MKSSPFIQPSQTALITDAYTPSHMESLKDLNLAARKGRRDTGAALVGRFGDLLPSLLFDHSGYAEEISLFISTNFERPSFSMLQRLSYELPAMWTMGTKVSLIIELLNPLLPEVRLERVLQLPEMVGILEEEPGLSDFPPKASLSAQRELRTQWSTVTGFAFETLDLAVSLLQIGQTHGQAIALQFSDKAGYPHAYSFETWRDGSKFESLVDGRYIYGSADYNAVGYLTNDCLAIGAYEAEQRSRQRASKLEAVEILRLAQLPKTREDAHEWINIHLTGVSNDESPNWYF